VESSDAARPPALPAEEVFRRVADAVVTIDVPDGQGAGVMLSASGLIGTSQHLVEGWCTALVRFRDGKQVRARVVRSFRDADLAFLQLPEEAVPEAVERVRCGLIQDRAPAGRTPIVGETVYAIGHPLGLPYTLTRGIVSAVGRQVAGRSYLQVDAAINPGNSGGPLYDGQAELVGLMACSRAESQGLNFAVTAEQVYSRFNLYLEEREQGARFYCCVCGAACRDPAYCDRCGALLALVDAVEELESAAGDDKAREDAEEESDGNGNGEGETEDQNEQGSEVMDCPVCGAACSEGAAYCAVCGATL
jgi:serine protease Do